MEEEQQSGPTQHDTLLGEIESSDGPVGPTLKTVYDSDGHKLFMQKLDESITHHDKEIEKMCNFHYQGFIESVNELLNVKGDTHKLKLYVQDLNVSFNNSGCELAKQISSLIQCRLMQRNIASAIETITLCLPVLEMYAKLQEQLDGKRYYPALKSLEQLEHTYLPRIKSFRFAEIMSSRIPVYRENIKKAAMSDLRDFLASIREHSKILGSIAMKQAQKRHNLSILHGVGAELNPFESEEDSCSSAHELVDFSPVYRGLHIYTVLGLRDDFVEYYRTQRRKQARLVLEANSGNSTTGRSLESYRLYFHEIVGFFVVEDTIMHTTQGLVTRSTIDEMWEMAVAIIAVVLKNQSGYCKETDLLIKVKELIGWFCNTLSAYGLTVSQLNDVLHGMGQQYHTILMGHWGDIFNGVFDEDNYNPIVCQSKQEFQDVFGDFPRYNDQLKEESFPKRIDFSECVIKVYAQIKEFIKSSLKFYENLNFSQMDIGDNVRRSTNFLITKTLAGCLNNVIRRKRLTLAQTVQTSINTLHLEAACSSLEEFVASKTGTSNDDENVARVYGLGAFKDVRAEAEQRVYEKLNQKMDQFLDLASYNWTASGSKNHASEYLVDLLTYLNVTFLTFTNLPGNVAQTACMSSCKHLANSLRHFLLDDRVTEMNMNGLQVFNQDLRKCEEFANSNPVEGFNDGTLQMTFTELRQLVDLLMSGDWSTYMADHGKAHSKYSRVNPSVAAKLLEKLYAESDKKKGISLSLRKGDREKKKLWETTIKKLRSLDGDKYTN
ncbi:exocyst complex component 6B-like [Dendronephthya gigantea]|uniref:exocyst complex component 6B-like n=1 Tax=Dendronephthya gigantea TaxID=151771 RepID=UPI0010692212|nr:exocyst complex component 6B-like [Dendronephthya gigantea]